VLLPPGAAVATPNVIAIDEIKGTEPEHILVVDDETTVLDVARVALERAGHHVNVAASGPEAIDLLRTSPDRFAIILLDLGMPRMSGTEVLPRLREINPTVPILLCSGYSETEMRRRSEGLTVTGFVQKPFTAKGLREKVALYLRAPQSTARSQNVS
jgi:CheY-like chemotaxis protein